MKLIEAISKIDNLKQNTFTHEDKVGWLSRLDHMVCREILDTHEGGGGAFSGYDTSTDVETELLVPAPWDEMYLRWLEARIDYANAEYTRYNNSMDMFRAVYQSYRSYYNRTHMPKGVRFRF